MFQIRLTLRGVLRILLFPSRNVFLTADAEQLERLAAEVSGDVQNA